MALPYVVQAATGNPGLALLPVAHYLTQHMGFSAAQLAGFQAVVMVPWMIKPFWAIAVDALIQRGCTTQRCLMVCFGLISLGFGGLSQVPSFSVGQLWLGLALISAVIACSDVIADRWMVVEGQRQQRGNLYQASQWVGWGSTAMAMFLVGGWLADRTSLNQVFGLSAVVPALGLLLVMGRWPAIEPAPSRHPSWSNCFRAANSDTPQASDPSPQKPRIFAALITTLKQPELRRVLGLVVLLHLSPLPIDYLYQVQELGFENRFVGQLKAVETLGTALGSLGFGLWAWRCARLPLMGLAVIGQAGAMLSLVALSADTTAAYGVYLLRGMFAVVSFLGLFGRVVAACPPQMPGLAYALVVSASNLAVSLGAVMGGTLYDWGLPFQGIALVGAGYTLLVGLWLWVR